MTSACGRCDRFGEGGQDACRGGRYGFGEGEKKSGSRNRKAESRNLKAERRKQREERRKQREERNIEMQELEGKHILLGVTGSISAFKAIGLASKLTQAGALVDVVATANGLRLAPAAAFEAVTHRKCYIDTFADTDDLSANHVSIGARADLALIAPCSANMLAKIAHGIADDKLSTTMLAVQCPVWVAPAMNCHMYGSASVQENLSILRRRGVGIVEPDAGNLACGYAGKGRMPEPDRLIDLCTNILARRNLLAGKRVIVTAGPTREYIDAVRYISNPSSGKMGYACARAAQLCGASVELVSGPTELPTPAGVERIDVVSAADMAQAVFERFDRADIVIMSAAVADYTPKSRCAHKMHKTGKEAQIDLVPTVDILAELGNRRRKDQFLCGFCMETENLVERAKEKRSKKKVDLIVANDLSRAGAGFGCNTNIVTLITEGDVLSLDMASKDDVARRIVDTIAQMMG